MIRGCEKTACAQVAKYWTSSATGKASAVKRRDFGSKGLASSVLSPEEKEVALGGVGNVAVGVEDELPARRRPERPRRCRSSRRSPGRSGRDTGTPPAVGQKDGPAVTDLRRTGVELPQLRGLAAGGRNAMDDLAGVRNEEDHTLAVPASSSAERRVRECLWGSARSVDLLQLPVGEEPDEPAVRGPEGIRSSCSVPASGRADTPESGWTHSMLFPEEFATKATRWPSGDTAIGPESEREVRPLGWKEGGPHDSRWLAAQPNDEDCRRRGRKRGDRDERPRELPRLFLRAAMGAGSPTAEPPSTIHWSWSLTSCAVWNRSSGSLASTS